jgi:hypothetical protein
MPGNTAKNADWERQKDTIYQFYFTEDRALKDVITLIRFYEAMSLGHVSRMHL